MYTQHKAVLKGDPCDETPPMLSVEMIPHPPANRSNGKPWFTFLSSTTLMKHVAYPAVEDDIEEKILSLAPQCGCPVPAGDVPAVLRAADGGVDEPLVQT